jgi:hypothetical protein
MTAARSIPSDPSLFDVLHIALADPPGVGRPSRWPGPTGWLASHPLHGAPVERFLARVPRTPPPPPPVCTELPVDPTAVAAACRIVALVLEVWNGRRPPEHLDPFFDPSPARYLRLVAAQLAPRRSARLSSIRICQPRTGAAEITAICRFDRRTRAVAARLEKAPSPSGGRPGWRCRVIQLG